MHYLSRIPLLLAALGTILLIAQPALSDDEVDYARTGLYVGASILGGSYLNLTDQLAKSTQDDLESDPSLGFDVYVGYRIHRFVAIEAEFEMLPSSDIDTNSSGTLSEVESLTGSVNAKFFAPLGRFQPFLLAGVGVADIENQPSSDVNVWVSDTEVMGRFGGGADIYITKNVVAHFSVEYIRPGGNLDDFDYMSYGTGLQYRF